MIKKTCVCVADGWSSVIVSWLFLVLKLIVVIDKTNTLLIISFHSSSFSEFLLCLLVLRLVDLRGGSERSV